MPSGGVPIRILDPQVRATFRLQLNQRLEAERGVRLSWWTHWALLSAVYCPRRYKWFITPNQYNRGSAMNGQIVDETGVLSARTLQSGMMSGMTSTIRPWFKIRLGVPELDDLQSVKIWQKKVEDQMYRVFDESNFYSCIGIMYLDLAVFGSASMLEYEDFDDVVRFQNNCLGEFFFAADSKQRVTSVFREFTLTVSQIVDQFGLENVCESTREAYRAGGAQRTLEKIVCHVVEPNTDLWIDGLKKMAGLVPSKFKYREVYWERQATPEELLACSGLEESCAISARWNIVGNDAYGYSPGMDAYPATMQLQTEQRRKAEAIDKVVRPPMVGSMAMKSEPSSTLPGSITYVPQLDGKDGYRAAYQIDPHLQWIIQDIQEVQARIEDTYFVPLFLMISQLETVRTATEIDARREEKLIQLGPVIERFQNEVLDPVIERTFNIMSRHPGVLPVAPPEIQGMPIKVQYVSMLAEAQRAASTAAIERVMSLTGNLMGVVPSVGDVIDWDEAIRDYADRLGVTPQIVKAIKDVIAIREARAQKEQQAEALQVTAASVQGAATLAKAGLLPGTSQTYGPLGAG